MEDLASSTHVFVWVRMCVTHMRISEYIQRLYALYMRTQKHKPMLKCLPYTDVYVSKPHKNACPPAGGRDSHEGWIYSMYALLRAHRNWRVRARICACMHKTFEYVFENNVRRPADICSFEEQVSSYIVLLVRACVAHFYVRGAHVRACVCVHIHMSYGGYASK